MLENLINKVVEDLAKYNNYTIEEVEIAKYTLKVILYEIIKILLIVFIFSFLGYFKESLLIIFIMSVTKPFIGGYHEDTQIKCFIVTLLLVALIIILFENNKLSFSSCSILNLINIFAIYNKAPVINAKMPITKKELIKKNRDIGIINSIVLIFISIIMFKVLLISQIIVWTILIQVILMFNKYDNKEVKK